MAYYDAIRASRLSLTRRKSKLMITTIFYFPQWVSILFIIFGFGSRPLKEGIRQPAAAHPHTTNNIPKVLPFAF
jgi:hypothetical protein